MENRQIIHSGVQKIFQNLFFIPIIELNGI